LKFSFIKPTYVHSMHYVTIHSIVYPLYVSPEILHLQEVCTPTFTIQSSTIYYNNSTYHSDFCH
jgi:hypothetical protein